MNATFSSVDIDECALGTSTCSLSISDCTNSNGSFVCHCHAGYTMKEGQCEGKSLMVCWYGHNTPSLAVIRSQILNELWDYQKIVLLQTDVCCDKVYKLSRGHIQLAVK